MKAFTARQAAKHLLISEEFLRMKLREGQYQDIGSAIRPGKGHKQWRYPCYPAAVAKRTCKTIVWNGITYHPDGTTEGEENEA